MMAKNELKVISKSIELMQYTYTITANKKAIHYKCPICEGNGNFSITDVIFGVKNAMGVERYMTEDNLYWLFAK